MGTHPGPKGEKHQAQICFHWRRRRRRLVAIPVLDNGQLGLGLGPKAGQVLAEVGLQGPAVELVLRQHFGGIWLAGDSVLHVGRCGTHTLSVPGGVPL